MLMMTKLFCELHSDAMAIGIMVHQSCEKWRLVLDFALVSCFQECFRLLDIALKAC
jgi:hypothetical protein